MNSSLSQQYLRLQKRAFESVPVLHNMSGAPRTLIHRSIRPVFGLTALSLPRLLRLHEIDFPEAKAAALEWAGGPSLKKLWRVLAQLNATHASATKAVEKITGVFIGWTRFALVPLNHSNDMTNNEIDDWRYSDENPFPFNLELCLNSSLTVGLLARRSGGLCLPQRPPEYSFENLLAREFLVDDPRLTAFTKEPK
jgi:hypothetical protein